MKKQLFPAGLSVELPKIDLEMTVHHVRHWELESEQMERGSFFATVRTIHTPRMQLHDVDYSHGFLTRGSFPRGCVMIGFVQSRGSVSYQNRPLGYGELLITADADEIDYLSSSRNTILTLSVEKRLFEEAYFAYFGELFEECAKDHRFFIEKEETALFPVRVRSWMRTLKEILPHAGMVEHYPRIEREILREIFGSIQAVAPVKERCRFDAKAARDLMHGSLNRVVNSASLTDALQISERQMERAFKRRYGITPKRYFLNLRLNAVRKALLSADARKTTVSEIAFRYNFFDLNSFSKAYKYFFAELPSQTLIK